MLAGDQFGQIFRLLLGARPAPDLVDAEVRMGAVAEPDRGRGARHLLLSDDMFEIAEAEPAILLGHRDSVQPERAHFRPQLLREPVLGVDPGGERRDLLGGEAAGGVADRVGHLAEFEVEAEFGHGCASPVASGPSRAPEDLNKRAPAPMSRFTFNLNRHPSESWGASRTRSCESLSLRWNDEGKRT